jgi:hypothetical protein
VSILLQLSLDCCLSVDLEAAEIRPDDTQTSVFSPTFHTQASVRIARASLVHKRRKMVRDLLLHSITSQVTLEIVFTGVVLEGNISPNG